jgi:hypothetical protein
MEKYSLLQFGVQSSFQTGSFRFVCTAAQCRFNRSTTDTPNVVVEWLTFLIRIREIPDSNLSQDTGYPD